MTPFRNLWIAAVLSTAACGAQEFTPQGDSLEATHAQGLSTLSVRGSSSASGLSLTSLSIPTPAGTAAGDVLVVQLTNRENVGATATAPAGWTLLRSEQSASAIKSWLFVRVATATEPSSHAFTIDLASAMAGSMVSVRGADPVQPVDVHLGQKNGNSASLALPTSTTTSSNGLAVWFSAQVWSGTTCPAVHTPPSGFTELLDTCLSSTSRGLLHSAAVAEMGAAGPQPAFTGSSTLPNTNNTHAVVLRPIQAPAAEEITLVGATHALGKGVTSLTVATPAGVVAGDVLLAHVANRNQASATVTPPAGWTLVRSDTSSFTIRGWVFARVVTGAEPANHTFTTSVASYIAANVVAYAGADPINPIEAHAGKSTSSSTSLSAPQLSTATTGGAAVWFGAQAWTGTTCPSNITPPTGFTETYDRCLDSSSQGLVFSSATRQLTTSGVQGPFNGSSPNAQTNVAHVVALRRAQGSSPSDVALRASSRASGLSLSSLSIARPSGVQANDLLLARISLRNNVGATLTPPSGWTFLRSEQSASAIRTWIFYRVAGASEPANYAFATSLSGNMIGSVEAFSGVDPANPIDVHAGQKNGESAAFTVPDVVIGSPNGLAVWYGTQVFPQSTCPTGGAIEPPLGFTEAFDTCLGASSGLLFNAAYRAFTSPGLKTGLSGSSPYPQTNTAHVIVLRSATAPACMVGDVYASSYTDQGDDGVQAPEIVEPSGIAASRVVGNALYVHNEDRTEIVAINTLNAGTIGTFNVSNVTPADWEDIATGPCPTGSCIFIGDIGRYSANFPTPPNSFAVYRVPEPNLAGGQATGNLVADAFPFVYPDGAKDAEALMVHPTTGDIYVITKNGTTGRSGVYRFPKPLTPGVQATLIHVNTIQLPTTSDSNFSAATAAAIHPCANRFILRTYRTVYEFRAAPGQGFESAFFATPVQLTDTNEGQGEAIEYEANGASYFTMSEVNPPFKLRRVPLL